MTETPTQEELTEIIVQQLVSRHASKVTELSFGNGIKLVRNAKGFWRLYVGQGWNATAMDFSDGFLYYTEGARGRSVYNDPHFYTADLADAVKMAEALADNLKGRNVVDSASGFMSRFINPVAFERQAAYWAGEGQVELKER